jgi:hypothetical protein
MVNPRRNVMSADYYDISVSACGFLNRVRTVEPAEGSSYLVCTLAALRGAKGERGELTYFDMKVVTDQARELIRLHQSVINDRSRKVFASVRLSDLVVKSFVRERGERKGETGFALKSRLLVIESLAIDGVVVYRRADDPNLSAPRERNRAAAPSSASSVNSASTGGNTHAGGNALAALRRRRAPDALRP